MTVQNTDTTKVQFVDPVSFSGVTYRNLGEELLTGAEMTQRHCITQAHSSMSDSSQNWEPGAHCSAGWRVSFQVPQ